MPRPVPFQVQQAGVDIGENLAAWRKLRNLTAQQVAERAGTTRQTVGRLERGDLSVGLDIVLGVARAVGVSAEFVRSVRAASKAPTSSG